MSTRDPFLMTFGIWLDRAAVWLTLTGVSFLLLWALVWQRGLGQPWTEAMRQLQTVLRGQADPIVNILCLLTLATAVAASSLLAAWLFMRWRRQGELHGTHVRGSQLDN